jgi:MFS family permease
MESTSLNSATNPMRAVIGIRDFTLLWVGQATSMLGDQFHGIAAAWLVLKLTGDPLALGTVMAVGGIPRAFFTLVGGAITDRFSPRWVMLASDILRLLLSALLAIQIFTGSLQVWMIYVYALIGGIVGGFFGPASMSIVPRIVPESYLGAGNSLTQGTSQLIGFLGPALAGVLIAAFPDEKIGTAVLIALDAFTFIVSIVTLWMMRTGGEVIASSGRIDLKTVFGSVKEGIVYMVKDPALRLMFIVIAVANMSFGGPVIVGIPYLADTRFPEGAAAYGIIISGYAGGNLLGILLAGGLPRPTRKVLRILLVALFVIFAVGIAAIGWISSTWLATLDLFVMGLLNGYISILLITALQRNTPKQMLGRLMSLVLFANMALIPISQAIAGGILRWNVPLLFVAASTLLGVLALYLTTPKASGAMIEQIYSG